MPRYLKQKSGLLFYTVAIIVAVGMMLGLRDCHADKAGYEIECADGDTLDVLIEYAPLSLYTYDDTLGGFDYDLLRMIAQRNGLRLKFHPVVSLSRSLTTIEGQRADLLLAEIPLTREYRDRYTFLEPVRIDRQVLVQMRDSVTGNVRVTTQLDLANDTVWVVDGSSVSSRITNLSHEIGDTIYIRSEPEYSSELLFIMAATGQIPMAVVSEQVALSMTDDYPWADISTRISLSQFHSWIVSDRCPWLADSLNRWIADIKDAPEYKALSERYIRK